MFDSMAETALHKKAKAEFLKAFNRYAALKFKHYGIVHEQPVLYYSEELALKSLPQPQTAHYLKEAERIEKRFATVDGRKDTHDKK
jgi:hypothetical protein